MRLLHWLRDGSQVSTSTTYSFTLNASATLAPVFAPNFSVLRGTFNGLVGDGGIGTGSAQDMADFPLNNGYISLVVASNGNFTGNLTLENQTDPFSGSFGTNKTATISIARASKASATALLELATALPGSISGNLSLDGSTLEFVAPRGSYASGNATFYSIVLPAPGGVPLGHSHGVLNFRSHATAALGTFAGRLSTNETFTASAQIVDSGNGSWVLPVYSRLASGGNATGIVTGEVVVPKTPIPGSPMATASLQWLRFASPGSTFVPDGFLVQLDGLGNPLARGNGISMLTGTAEPGNFTLILDPQSTVLASPISQGGVWTANNTASLIAPIASNLTMGAIATTGDLLGTYSGTFLRTAQPSPVSTRYLGNVLTTPVEIGGIPVRGAGYFLTGNASIPVLLTVP
jgi:hypothetical protein